MISPYQAGSGLVRIIISVRLSVRPSVSVECTVTLFYTMGTWLELKEFPCLKLYVSLFLIREVSYVCMYVHVHVCMYVCTCICTYVCMYACTCMHVCMHVHVCMYMYMYVCMYVCMHVHVCMYVCTYVCMHVCSMYMYVLLFVYHLSLSSSYVLLHHVMGEIQGRKNAWVYPEGGMGAVSASIARAALSYGVDIYTEQVCMYSL